MIQHSEASHSAGGFEDVPELKHHTLEVLGGPISVYEAGEPGKPALFLLHGAMYDESRFIWDQLFPFLSRSYRVFAMDTPRHGHSRPWFGNLTHDRLVEILHATITQMELETFGMIGLSMGGALSIEFASRYPKHVNSMVLFEPGGLGDKVDWQFFTWLYIKTPGLLHMLSKRYVKMDDPAIEKLLNTIFVKGTSPTDPKRLVSILKEEIHGKFQFKEKDMDDWQLNAIGPFKLKWNLMDRIPLIQCPTLWLRGADSVLVKQHEMERAVKLAQKGGSNATLQVIEKAGHLLPLEQPSLANQAVKQFLEKNLRMLS